MRASIFPALFTTAVLLVLLQLLAGFLWPEVLWGAHHLGLFSPPAGLGAGILALAALALVHRHRERLDTWQPRILVDRRVLYTGVPLLSLALFWAFRARHWLLGDAWLIAYQGPLDLDFQFGGKNTPYFLSLLHGLLGWSDTQDAWVHTLTLVACAAGALYALCALLLADSLGKDRVNRAFVFVAAISTGVLQLFFGYVEHYALPTLCLGLWALCLVRWEGRRSTWLAGALGSALAAFALHPIALFVFPSLALAVWFQLSARWPGARGRTAAAALPAAALAAICLWILGKNPADLLSLAGEADAYHLFSACHLRDIFNVYLLAIPLHGVLCGIVLWQARARRWWGDPILLCLLAGTGAAWGSAFLIEPALGSLDWDLLSLYAVPGAALTGYLVARHAAQRLMTATALSFAIAALLHLVPWVAANADSARGAAMVEAMVARDCHHCGERNTKLGAKLQGMGLAEAAWRQYRKALACTGDPLAMYNLALTYYIVADSVDTALELFADYLKAVPPDTDRRLVESILAFHGDRPSRAAFLCAAFLIDHPAYDRAHTLALSLLDQAQEERDRLLLQSAILFAEGRHIEAVDTCTELLLRNGNETAVREFSMNLYGKYPSDEPR